MLRPRHSKETKGSKKKRENNAFMFVIGLVGCVKLNDLILFSILSLSPRNFQYTHAVSLYVHDRNEWEIHCTLGKYDEFKFK